MSAENHWGAFPSTKNQQQRITDRLAELQPEFEVIRTVCGRLVATFMWTPELSASHRVHLIGLGRLVDSWEATLLMLRNGFTLDARTLVATQYEMAYLMCYVGDDDTRAMRWLEAGEGGGQAFSVYQMVAAVHAAKLIEGDVEIAYNGLYDALCAVKHNSAAEIVEHYLRFEEGDSGFSFGGFCQLSELEQKKSILTIVFSAIMLGFGAHSAARRLGAIEACNEIKAANSSVIAKMHAWVPNVKVPDADELVEIVRRRKAAQEAFHPRRKRK